MCMLSRFILRISSQCLLLDLLLRADMRPFRRHHRVIGTGTSGTVTYFISLVPFLLFHIPYFVLSPLLSVSVPIVVLLSSVLLLSWPLCRSIWSLYRCSFGLCALMSFGLCAAAYGLCTAVLFFISFGLCTTAHGLCTAVLLACVPLFLLVSVPQHMVSVPLFF